MAVFNENVPIRFQLSLPYDFPETRTLFDSCNDDFYLSFGLCCVPKGSSGKHFNQMQQAVKALKKIEEFCTVYSDNHDAYETVYKQILDIINKARG